MVAEKKYINENCEAFLMDDKIMYIHYFEDAIGEIDDMKHMLDLQHEIGVNESFTRLIHAEKYVTITKEARDYLQANAPEVGKEAYVIPSLSQKIIFNVYIKLRKNSHPIKAFDKLEDALDWLKK